MGSQKDVTKDRDKHEPANRPPPAEPPPTDTSSDRDEWMEKHGGRPRSVPDVADTEGRFRDPGR